MQPTTVQRNRSPDKSLSAPAITGRCLCGAVTITVAGGDDPRVGACHCRMCQRWSGGLFLCFQADASAITVSGDVARYRSSAFAARAFCPRCGSHLWFNEVEPDVPDRHHDAVEFPDGSHVLVTQLVEGQRVSVLQLPALHPPVEQKPKVVERRPSAFATLFLG